MAAGWYPTEGRHHNSLVSANNLIFPTSVIIMEEWVGDRQMRIYKFVQSYVRVNSVLSILTKHSNLNNSLASWKFIFNNYNAAFLWWCLQLSVVFRLTECNVFQWIKPTKEVDLLTPKAACYLVQVIQLQKPPMWNYHKLLMNSRFMNHRWMVHECEMVYFVIMSEQTWCIVFCY